MRIGVTGARTTIVQELLAMVPDESVVSIGRQPDDDIEVDLADDFELDAIPADLDRYVLAAGVLLPRPLAHVRRDGRKPGSKPDERDSNMRTRHNEQSKCPNRRYWQRVLAGLLRHQLLPREGRTERLRRESPPGISRTTIGRHFPDDNHGHGYDDAEKRSSPCPGASRRIATRAVPRFGRSRPALAWAGMESEPYYRLLIDMGVFALEVAPTVLFDGGWASALSRRDASRCREDLAAKGLTTVGLQSLFHQYPECQLAEGPETETAVRLVAHARQLVPGLPYDWKDPAPA